MACEEQKDEFKNYYEILGVSISATNDEIKRAYRALVKKWHPDNPANDPELSNEKMKEINEAYEVLSNPKKRKNYDIELRDHEQAKNACGTQNKTNASNGQRQNAQSSAQEAYWQRWANEEPKATSQGSAQYGRRHQQRNDTKKAPKRPPRSEKSFWWNVREDYKEVKRDEGKNPFSKRHKEFTEDLDDSFVGDLNRFSDRVVFHTTRITFNAIYEVIYQLKKLGRFGKEPFPKFVIRNRKLAGVILAGAVMFNAAGSLNSQESQPQVPEQESIVELQDEDEQYIKLYRSYTIELGDSLWDLSSDANISVAELQEQNGLSDSRIYIGDNLKIIYNIPQEELEYYTEGVQVDGMSLTDIAKAYETNVSTLVLLNPESIIKDDDGRYVVLSDTLTVPKFISKDELSALHQQKQLKND